MRILYITQWFSAVGGGGEVLFFELANGLARRGHVVHVISHQLADSKDNNLHNIEIHRIKPLLNNFPPSMSQNIMFIINAIWMGWKIIRKDKLDILHVNNFSPVIVGTILSKICNIPLIKTFHVVFSATPNYWNKWSAQKNVYRLSSIIGPLFEKLIIRTPADAIHAVSEATKKDLVKFNANSKIVVITNIVNLSVYDNLNLNNSNENYILFIGRLVFNKNLGTVISAFKQVIKKIPDAKLIVIGTGPMIDEWKTMVSELVMNQNVLFAGYISHEEKLNLLGKCSALVLPSITEGLPTVILESFAMNKPVIVSNIEPHSDIVEDAVDGFLIPPYDAQKWAEKIIRLLSDKAMCERMGYNGRLKVKEKYNVDVMLDKMELLYGELKNNHYAL